MTKQEQIKEMKKIIGNVKPFYVETIVEALYNAGYRKIPENAVVLTKEEYIDLSRNYVTEQIEQARKKTAKEIYERLIELSENPCNGREEIYKTVFEKYGVEMEE